MELPVPRGSFGTRKVNMSEQSRLSGVRRQVVSFTVIGEDDMCSFFVRSGCYESERTALAVSALDLDQSGFVLYSVQFVLTGRKRLIANVKIDRDV